MKNLLISVLALSASGCAACHQPSAPAGIPMAGMTATTQSTVATQEATPAIGFGRRNVSFSLPTIKMFAVPKPQVAPQVVGIPILTGGPTMTMGAAPMMAQPQAMMAQPQMVQQQFVPQGNPSPQSADASIQSTPQSQPCINCQPACTEGCNSQASVAAECDALIREISCLQEQISVETSKASVRTTR